MRFILLLCILSQAFRCAAQQDALATYVQTGIHRHDAGDYDGAIRLYDSAIAINPGYYLAYSEKSFSLFKAGKYQECADLCRQILKDFPKNEDNGKIYTNYASALDALGQAHEAIRIYSDGIRKYPHEHLLYFNRGITEYSEKDIDAAVKDMEESLRLSPGHAGSHQALAYCVFGSNRIASTMALAAFLLVEPKGPRAEKNLVLLNQALRKNISQQNDSNVTISLSMADLNGKPKRDDDFHLTELSLSLSAALDDEETAKGKTPAQLLEKKLEFLADAIPTKKGFFSHFYVPFFAGLQKAGLLEVASHYMYMSANNAIDFDWLQTNQDKVDKLREYVQNIQNWGVAAGRSQ